MTDLRVAMIAGLAVFAASAAQASPISFNLSGTGSLGAPTGITSFTGSGSGTSVPYGPVTFTANGTVDTTGASGIAGLIGINFNFGAGNGLQVSFNKSSFVPANPLTLTPNVTAFNGTGTFQGVTGNLAITINGFPTGTTAASFTVTGTGNLNLAGTPPPTSGVPEPASGVLLAAGLAGLLLLRSQGLLAGRS